MILGIDSASVAGNRKPDWHAVRAAGVSFVYLRASYGVNFDRQYGEFIQGAREAGLVVGPYAFLRLNRPDINEQVDAAMHQNIGLYKQGDLPLALDIEFPGGAKKMGLSQAEAMAAVNKALARARLYEGWPCIVYSSARVYREDLGNPDPIKLAPLWLARYPFRRGVAVRDPRRLEAMAAPPTPKGWEWNNWWIHQYQGDATGLPGMNGKVDMNRFNPMVPGRPDSPQRVNWVARALRLMDWDGSPAYKGGIVEAVKEFQRGRGLVPDGIIGPRTFAHLCK